MNDAGTTAMTHPATFCGSRNCGCPEFEQLHDLVSDVKSGAIDQLLAPVD